MRALIMAAILAGIGFPAWAAQPIPNSICAGVNAAFVSGAARYEGRDWSCTREGQTPVVGTTKPGKTRAVQHSLLVMGGNNTPADALGQTAKLVGNLCLAAGGAPVTSASSHAGLAIDCRNASRMLWSAEGIATGSAVALQITE